MLKRYIIGFKSYIAATAVTIEEVGATSIEDAGKEELNGTDEGVGEDATTVVTGGMVAGADDVAITGVDDEKLNGTTDGPGTGTIGCVLAGVTPWTAAGVDARTNAGVFVELNAGVFAKVPDG